MSVETPTDKGTFIFPEPFDPVKLTDKDKGILETYIGFRSSQHGEFYLRTTYRRRLREREFRSLGASSLVLNRVQAISALQQLWGLAQDEAFAADLFCRAFPETVKELIRRQNPDNWPEQRRVAQPNPFEELNLTP